MLIEKDPFEYKRYLKMEHTDFLLHFQGGIANAFDIPGVSLLLRHVIQDQVIKSFPSKIY